MPPAMVKKYAGKAMAIVGWEIDQVRRTPEGDVSVPISATYNHHYTAQVIGAKARFRKVMLSGPEDKYAAEVEAQSHGHVAWDQPHYVVEELEKPSNGGATSQAFSSANGGEYRKVRSVGVEAACRCGVCVCVVWCVCVCVCVCVWCGVVCVDCAVCVCVCVALQLYSSKQSTVTMGERYGEVLCICGGEGCGNGGVMCAHVTLWALPCLWTVERCAEQL